jgi:deoxyribonuclease V
VKLAVDVQYHPHHAIGAAIGFIGWGDAIASLTITVDVDLKAEYQPGEFYKRELPALLELIRKAPRDLELVIVDAYVDLEHDRPGLGRRLHEAIGVPVIGVAKSRFRGAPGIELFRGGSTRPLYVTAAGLDVTEAAAHIRSMHGIRRLPTMIAAADRLARHG